MDNSTLVVSYQVVNDSWEIKKVVLEVSLVSIFSSREEVFQGDEKRLI